MLEGTKGNLMQQADEYMGITELLSREVENEGGELVETYQDNAELIALLEQYEASIATKFEGYAYVIRDVEALEELAKREANRIQARADRYKAKAKWLKDRMKAAMTVIGSKKLATATITVSIQNNGGAQALKIGVAAEKLPAKYFQAKTVYDAKADVIRADLLAGVAVPDCKLEPRGTHLRIR